MTCDFHTPLPAKLGDAMVEAHWAANGTHLGASGDKTTSEKTTTTPAKGVELETAESVSQPAIAGFDQPADDHRLAAPHLL